VDRFQVTPGLVSFEVDSGKSVTVTNIGSATVYGSPDAMFPNVAAAAWTLAPGASRVEDQGPVWVRTADGTSSVLTLEFIASGTVIDVGSGLPSSGASATDLRQAAVDLLGGSTILQSLLTAPVMGSPPTLGTATTGLTTGTEPAAAAAWSAGAVAVKPNYAQPWNDTTYRIVGPYTYLNALTSQDMGAVQNVTPGGTGPTGAVGTYSYEFTGRKLLWRRRATTLPQYVQMYVSKDGGPFQKAWSGAQTLADPGVSGYMLQEIDFGSSANWRIIMDGESLTFGGFWRQSTDALAYPSWDTKTMVVIGDSYTAIGGAGFYRGDLTYALRAARRLGMECHISGYGGTGFVNDVSGAAYNYGGRLAAQVLNYFSASRQPAAVVVQQSTNDEAYAGNAQLVTNANDVFGRLQIAYPNAFIVTNRPMHPWRGNATNNALDEQGADAIKAGCLTARGIPEWNAVTSVPLTGTGWVGNVVGDGTSDLYSWTDGNHHPSPDGMIALGDGYATFLAASIGSRPYKSVSIPRVVAPTNFATPYRLLKTAYNRFDAQGANTGIALQENGSASLGTASSGKCLFPIVTSDFDVAGYSTLFKLRLEIFTNDTSPGVTFTAWLKQVAASDLSGAAAAVNVAAAGGTVAGSTITATPGANAIARSDSADFALSSGAFVPVISVPGAGMAANSSAVIRVELYVHNA
jgi:hypothetical protein